MSALRRRRGGQSAAGRPARAGLGAAAGAPRGRAGPAERSDPLLCGGGPLGQPRRRPRGGAGCFRRKVRALRRPWGAPGPSLPRGETWLPRRGAGPASRQRPRTSRAGLNLQERCSRGWKAVFGGALIFSAGLARGAGALRGGRGGGLPPHPRLVTAAPAGTGCTSPQDAPNPPCRAIFTVWSGKRDFLVEVTYSREKPPWDRGRLAQRPVPQEPLSGHVCRAGEVLLAPRKHLSGKSMLWRRPLLLFGAGQLKGSSQLPSCHQFPSLLPGLLLSPLRHRA